MVDAPASGHIIGQLAAPQAINDLVKVGLIRSQTDWMLDILSDERQTGPGGGDHARGDAGERDLELATRVREETTVRMSAVGRVNRVLPELFGQREEEVFERLRAPEVERVLSERAGGDVTPVLEAARLAVTMRRTRSAHMQRLQAGLDPRAARALLPYLFARASRAAHDAPGGPRPRRGARAVTARRAAGRAATTVAQSARRQGDRHRLRAGRGGQDHDRGRARPRPWRPSRAAACWCSRSTRRGGWPTRWG